MTVEGIRRADLRCLLSVALYMSSGQLPNESENCITFALEAVIGGSTFPLAKHSRSAMNSVPKLSKCLSAGNLIPAAMAADNMVHVFLDLLHKLAIAIELLCHGRSQRSVIREFANY